MRIWWVGFLRRRSATQRTRSATRRPFLMKPLSRCLATLGLVSLPSLAQMAPNTLPRGAVVSAGAASLSQSGSLLTIDQASSKAIIDWQSFSIGRDATVRFNQPSTSAIVLNRVGPAGGPSLIDGSLTAHGPVWLLNPGGTVFGANATVNVGGLLNSSLALGNADFIAGKYSFSGGGGAIVNQGRLTATDGGYIALLAPQVRNEGVITARLGTVALASGQQVRLDFNGDRLIEIQVDQAAVDGLIENRNLIQADGGWVLMSARAAGELAGGAINVSGIVRAQSLVDHDGVIRLDAGQTLSSGTLDVSSAAGTGGTIQVLGQQVGITAGTLDASGARGGGSILVGGGFQGQSVGPANAQFSYVASDATLIFPS